MKAVVAGAGIGGLAAALALSKKGWQVEVLEQASELSEVGAGLQLSPNAVRVLQALNVMPALEPHVFEPETISLAMGKSGRRIFQLQMKGYAERRWGARYLQVHRADLHAVLVAALAQQPAAVVKTGARVTGYVREKGGAGVYLENEARVFGDLVIGADGLHSVIRQQMTGQDRARFTGNAAWRCVVPLDALGDVALPPGGCVWAGEGKHAVTTRVRAGQMVNFVGIVEQSGWTQEGWSVTGSKEDALRDFEGWVPQVTAIVKAAPTLNRWALFDRPPLAKWSDGPVTLLGDAAHPMLPSMAQGAGQALEDALILAECLSEAAEVPVALDAYFQRRIKRVTRVQRRSADNLALFHKKGRVRQLASYAPIWMAGMLAPGVIHSRQDWIYGYDTTQATR